MIFFNRVCRTLLLCLSLIQVPELIAATQSLTVVSELSLRGKSHELPEWERAYLARAVERLFSNCRRDERVAGRALRSPKPNHLIIESPDGGRRLVQAQAGSANPFAKLALYEETADGTVYRYRNCRQSDVLPVASIMESRLLTMKPPRERTRAGLTSYQPNTVGWTFDDNDVNEGYLDALLSVKYPFFHDGYYSAESGPINLYFAFTGRFSQYIESRDSSPVVAKRFNPKFFSRYWLGDDSRYIDVGYGHESNGQSINSEEAYLRQREDYLLQGEDPDFARDSISRGWDYLSLDWKHKWDYPAGSQSREYGLTTYAMLKYFLDDGLLQGEPEEYNDWEGDGRNFRKEYDGITWLTKYEFSKDYCLTGLAARNARDFDPNFCLQKVAWQYTTGYDGVFDNSTNRLELTVSLWDVPVMLWGQTGYNSDLVDYYRDVDSWGLALELQSF